jgi:hypothetical protein
VLYGFIGSRVLLTADELGVFEALTQKGPVEPYLASRKEDHPAGFAPGGDVSGTGPMSAVMQHMAMMLETGGRHRSQGEYESMPEQAGFVKTRIISASGEKHMVTAIKPAVAMGSNSRN